MSHDLDRALRDSLRRHADSAPTVVDTAGVRVRARQIQRRRVIESAAAAFVLLGVVLGLGAVVGSLRNDATPPPVTTGTPHPNPGNLAPLAYSTGDGNNPDRVIVRVDGVGTEVPNPTPGKQLAFLGWYGSDHRTLVLSSRDNGLREVTLYAATLGADGRIAGTPELLRVPGATLGLGVAFPVRGGPLQFWVPLEPGSITSPSSLVTIAADLSGATARALPDGLVAVAATADHVVLGDPATARVSVASLAGTGTPTAERVAACIRPTAVTPSLDGVRLALGCFDGTVDVVTLADRRVTHLAALPEVTPDITMLGMWWDPSGGLHAATNPTGRPDYTEVHDWDWTGTDWTRGALDGVLTRIYPVDAPSARFMKENAAPGNNGRWIVESSPEVDLGPGSDTLAMAPSTRTSPSPSASASSTNPPIALPLPQIATVSTYDGTAGAPGGSRLSVTYDGRTSVVDDAENAAMSVLGWYGAGHRTLVWQVGQDQMALRSASFDDGGQLVDGPHPLTLPGLTVQDTGYGFALPSGGFVFVRALGDAAAFEAVRVDDALTVGARTPVGSSGTPVFATADAVGMQLDATTVRVFAGGQKHDWILPAGCEDGGEPASGTPPTPESSGSWVAYRCAGGVIAQIPLQVLRGGGRVTTVDRLPGGGAVVGTWFDKDVNLWASTRSGPDATTATTYRGGIDYEPTWVTAKVQDVLYRVDSGQGFWIGLYASPPVAGGPTNSWWTETTPMQRIGDAPGELSATGSTIAVRPKG